MVFPVVLGVLGVDWVSFLVPPFVLREHLNELVLGNTGFVADETLPNAFDIALFEPLSEHLFAELVELLVVNCLFGVVLCNDLVGLFAGFEPALEAFDELFGLLGFPVVGPEVADKVVFEEVSFFVGVEL